MKVLFSQLQKYLPDLKASVQDVSHVYTTTGFMLDKKFDVEVNGKKDTLLDLEVRQNRADSFGVLGLSRELSAYYNIPLKKDAYKIESKSDYKLPINIKAKEAVKRVMAIKINSVKVEESPVWLKEYLKSYEINSINNIVDLTNYVMLETAHASHAFDVDLVGTDALTWEINPSYKKLVTLSGDEAKLYNESLVISDGKRPLSLSIVGGKEVAINNDTKNIIIEMAVYDPALIRRNSRTMKIITEASQRLEKHLDPETIPYAFNMLISMILETAGGEIASSIFDEYLQKKEKSEIKVDLDKVSQIAGIEISYEESKNYLNRLGFEVLNENQNILTVLSPDDRTDISLEEDVFEEIIRLKGYENIPKDRLYINPAKDITPSRLNLIDKIKVQLANIGFDEVRSWVLVDEEKNKQASYLENEQIQVSNSINEEASFLRNSLGVSLIGQFENYKKNNVQNIRLFEEGKVFYKNGKSYSENYQLGILTNNKNLNDLRLALETIIRSSGVDFINVKPTPKPALVSHPKTSFDVFAGEEYLGILYKTNKLLTSEEVCLAEINLDTLSKLADNIKHKSSEEILQKLVDLDTNIILDADKNIILEVKKRLNSQENIWSWEIVDTYKDKEGKVKYTLRVTYMHLTDPEAKELHRKIFN